MSKKNPYYQMIQHRVTGKVRAYMRTPSGKRVVTPPIESDGIAIDPVSDLLVCHLLGNAERMTHMQRKQYKVYVP